jgi:hypothetical protein
MGKVDQTLFLLRQGRDILIVQVYVDDIVFGGSSNSLVGRFAEDMSREFEMSTMGELQIFLKIQIKQLKEGTFMHQAKYTKDFVRKFKMEDSKAMATPMSTTTTLDADEEGEHVDQTVLQQLQTGPTGGCDRCATTQSGIFEAEDTRRDRMACVEAKQGAVARHPSDGENLNTSKTALEGLVSLVIK